MLHIAHSMAQLNFSKLMNVYIEGNRENAVDRYPDLPEGQGILQAEQDFYQYLRYDFFSVFGAYYAVLQENGEYISALRIEPYKDGVLLTGLETSPKHRNKGYAEMLVRQALSKEKKVYSHVGKQNAASLRVHEKCGFTRIWDRAVYIDGSVNSKCCTLCYERIGEKYDKES